MASNINYAGNTYSGDVLEDLLVYTTQGNDTFNEGLIHIKAGVQKRYVLPHIKIGEIIQDNKPTPTADKPAGAGDDFNQYTFAERYLDPQDLMVYLEFNPRDFEEYWKPFQPDGQLNFRELDPKVQSKMLHLLIDKKDQYIGDSIWCGRKGGVNANITAPDATCVSLGGKTAAGPMKYFDGAVARILANLKAQAVVKAGVAANITDDIKNEVATGKAVLAGDTKLTTGEQVEAALYAMWRACPKQLRKHTSLKYVMGWEAWDLYDEYLTKKESKYVENGEVNKRHFKGKPIVVINGIPEHTIFLGKFGSDMNSNLWMGVDYATDQESVKIERLQANSELYFFQMRMKMDVNFVLPGEIVVHTAYKNA